jgi:hypothetical protein
MKSTQLGGVMITLVLAGALTVTGCRGSRSSAPAPDVRADATAVGEAMEQIEEKDLPEPVAAAMHSHPRAILVTATKVTQGADVRYELTLRGTRKTAMVVKPDGTVVSFE